MKYFITLLFACLSYVGYSQEKIEGEVLYRISLKKRNLSELEKNKKISKKRKEEVKKVINFSKDVEATLSFNKGESLYSVKKRMQNELNKRMNFAGIFAGGSNKYYVDLFNKDFFYQTDTYGEVLLIEMKQKNWKLTQEAKKIGKYICYKAIDLDSKNQKTVAWYTPEIPVNFGPKKYFGLPGLILEVEESSITFKAIKIEINTSAIKIIKPKKGKKITTKEYNEIVKKRSPFNN